MNNELPKIWDLEDLIKFGNKKTVCPYFLARELMPSSNVIFCPYNYIIDPLIRKSVSNTIIVTEVNYINFRIIYKFEYCFYEYIQIE